MINFNNSNFVNNFNVTIATVSIKKNHINNSYLYYDIDNL